MVVGIDASRAVSARPTGTETYSRELIQALLKLDASHRYRLYFRTPPSAAAYPGADVRVMPFPRLWTHVRLAWELARQTPDALFVPAHVIPIIHPPITLVTIHDLGYRYFPRSHPPLQRFYLDLSTRWNARVAAHILADSEATKSDLVTHYRPPPEKVTVAYPGLDERLAPVEDSDAIAAVKARYHIDGRYYLYLGTLQPRKNLTRLIDAFAQLETDAKLVLAGKRGWLYDDLFSRVERMGLSKRVRFTGYLPDADKPALLSGALAFVFPSLYEGFGLPALEAQACACPVIVSDSSSLPEATGGAALLIDPTETDALAQAMGRLADNASLRQSLIARGLANARRFSWARSARVLLSTLDQFVV